MFQLLSTERIIALARVAFAAIVGLAVVLGPADAGTAYPALYGYLGYAVVLASAPERLLANRILGLAGVVADLLAIWVLVRFTDEVSSAFFAAIFFVLFAATLRWNWRGSLGAAVVLIALLACSSLTTVHPDLEQAALATNRSAVPDLPEVSGAPTVTGSLSEPDEYQAIDTNGNIMRIGSVLIAALMLAYLGAARERIQSAAARLTTELERSVSRAEAAERRAVGERIRFARDMHDGFLQDLAAANLLLRSAVTSVPEAARGQLAEVGTLISQQQRRLRSLVESINPRAPATSLHEELCALAATLSRTWNCSVGVDVWPISLNVPVGLQSEVCFLFGEAIANAVRHGRAKRIDLSLRIAGNQLVVEFRDDGETENAASGNEIESTFEPFSLRQRVADLCGRLTASRGASGALVRVELPVS